MAPTTQALELGRETEVLVRSYCRAHPVSVRHRVLALRGPLAPDTDRHHRRIRERLVDCRADGCAGRDEKDVGVVRSCSCGVAEKKSAALNGSRGPRSKLTRNPEPDSVWNGAPERAALVQEWYYAMVQLSSNNVMLFGYRGVVQTEKGLRTGADRCGRQRSARSLGWQHRCTTIIAVVVRNPASPL
jgi:hypothetical protein